MAGFNSRNRIKATPSVSASLPAPVGGWNARDSVADMDPRDAVTMTNWFPSASDVMVRNGYSTFAQMNDLNVESLLVYASPTTNKLFAAAGSNFYDVTSGGTLTANYLDLPGAAGDFATTPDSADLDIVGDIQIIGYIAPDSVTPSVDEHIASKFTSAGNQRAYRVSLTTTGALLLQRSTDGTSATVDNIPSSVPVPFVSGQGFWFKATFNTVTGVYNYYTSTDPLSTAVASLSFTALGDPVVGPAGAIFASTSQLGIGQQTDGTLGTFNGKIYRVLIYDGIGGTLVADFNSADASAGAATVVSATTGETYTLQGNADIVGSQQLALDLTNVRWQYTNISTAGGNFLIACNGSDPVYSYNGSVWANPAITGVTPADLIHVTEFKNRLWFTQKNSLKAWYLPVDSIAGAASEFNLQSVASQGGYLVGAIPWTIDAGYGVDDMLVFITSKGEAIVYRGTDPSQASLWTLAGIWQIGSPIGRRCFQKWKGDVLVITYDGVVPLSAALQSSRVNPRVALTDKIRQAMSNAVSAYNGNFGWEMTVFPRANMLVTNIPVNTGANQQQYVMNTITGAWCNFTGWSANCFAIFNDDLYFGAEGYVAKAWDTFADNSAAISYDCKQAFNYFGTHGQQKQWTMMRPIINTDGTPGLLANLNVDFDDTAPTAAVSFSGNTYATWDGSFWDAGTWGGGLAIQKNWQGVTGVGFCAAPRLKGVSGGIEVHWVATDLVMRRGAIL